MWPNPQIPADLVTFTEVILNGKLHFLCSEYKPMHFSILLLHRKETPAYIILWSYTQGIHFLLLKTKKTSVSGNKIFSTKTVFPIQTCQQKRILSDPQVFCSAITQSHSSCQMSRSYTISNGYASISHINLFDRTHPSRHLHFQS